MVNSLLTCFSVSTAKESGQSGGTANQSQVLIDLCCPFSAFFSCSTGIQLCLSISLISPKPKVSLHQEQYCFTFFTCNYIIQVCLNTNCQSHIPGMLWYREMPPPACGGLVSIAAKILCAEKKNVRAGWEFKGEVTFQKKENTMITVWKVNNFRLVLCIIF